MQYDDDFLIMYGLIQALARKYNKFMPDIESVYNLAKREFYDHWQHKCAVGCPPDQTYWQYYIADKCTMITKQLQ